METTTSDYQRALDAEPQLGTAVLAVNALCALAGPENSMCSGCAWELIIKPICLPYIGHCRGVPLTQATDSTGVLDLLITPDELFALPDAPEATSDTERWLRTIEAYDAFTRPLIARLEAADPGNGCRIGRLNEATRS